jgi:D-alanine-D-alanine ligase
MIKPGRVLVLWNQVEEDVYERLRADGPRTVEGTDRIADTMSTVAEELSLIVRSLRERGHTVHAVNINDSFATLVGAITEHKPDAIFNLVEFFGDDQGHEMHVAGVYELLDVAYTGNRPETLALCQRKNRTKAVLAAAGVPTPRYAVVTKHDAARAALGAMKFPMIVKPTMDDASGGIDAGSVVADRAALDARVEHLLAEYPGLPVLVEEFIDGREIHCAILGTEPLPLFEMVFQDGAKDADGTPLPRIITYKAKWDPQSPDFYAMDGVCPVPDLEPEVVQHLERIALRAFDAVGCRDYARVDMRIDPKTGDAFVLEVNPNPDLSDVCAFVQCATASGRTYAQLVDEIAGFALRRARVMNKRPPKTGPSDQMLREYLARNKPRKRRRTGT